ncbi:hypothetical protein N7454_005504 [Penicillium verhagenii]|nr:hypothetical protein N7454_005504 [Penicillium verhagenii]
MNKLLIGFLLFQFISVIDASYDCGRPWCETCLSTHIHDAPGIGFDLTPSYGTASVHYYNGTVVEVGHVQGNPEYLELMKRLTRDSRLWFDRTKKSSILSRFSLSDTTAWGAWWRWLNKKLGSPIKAHNDVEIISELLQVLQNSTEKVISQPLDRVAVTTPDLSSISSIVNAALGDLNLRTWVGDSGFYPRSLAEADAFSPSSTVGIFYTPASWPQWGGQALSRYNLDDAQLLDFNLGLDNLLQTKRSQDSLWPHLRSQLLALPRNYSRSITHIFLAGESVTHPRFLATLRDAMAEIMPTWPGNLQTNIPDHAGPAVVSKIVDPTFAASRGAALYARRRQEVQAGCTERSTCEATRNEERVPLSLKEDLR